MESVDLRLERNEYCGGSSCLKLLMPNGADHLMKTDPYHPEHCNQSSTHHHHPFHHHVTTNNHRTGKGTQITNRWTSNNKITENIEWVKQYKQIPDTNIFVDAFECYPKIKKIMKSNSELNNAHTVLMNRNKREQIVFILTHFHWNSYRGLHKYHKLILNKNTRNVIYCSEITAKLIRYKLRKIEAKYIKILRINEETAIHETLPMNKRVFVTALNANHVYGSIMTLFKICKKHNLFDPNTVYHLHSGDCNVSPNDDDVYNALKDYRNRIDTLWIDTKSLSFWLNPMQHNECVNVIKTHILDKHIRKSKETQNKRILINVGKYYLGLERIIVDIAKHLKQTYDIKICLKPNEVQLISMLTSCDDIDITQYVQTPKQWTQNKEKMEKEYSHKLEKYKDEKRRNIEGRKVFKITNKEDYDLMFNEEKETRFKVCAYCHKLHQKRVYIDGCMYWIPDICQIFKMENDVNDDMNDMNDMNNEFVDAKPPECWYNYAWVQCVNMNRINFVDMQFALRTRRYSMVIGIVISSKCQRLEVEVSDDERMMIYYVPYKQHSTKPDLRYFIKRLRPKNKIYPLHDNFNKDAIKRQLYQLIYYTKELDQDAFLMTNNINNNIFTVHHHNNCNIKKSRKRMANHDQDHNKNKKRRIDQRSDDKCPTYYYCNDDNEWISVYDDDSVVSDYSLIRKQKDIKKELLIHDDESSFNERSSFLEDDEKAIQLNI